MNSHSADRLNRLKSVVARIHGARRRDAPDGGTLDAVPVVPPNPKGLAGGAAAELTFDR